MYGLFLKTLILKHYYNNSFNGVDNLLSVFQISRSTLYRWINGKVTQIKPRKVKITSSIQQHIIESTLKTQSMNRFQLMNNIKQKFSCDISKSSVYRVLKQNKITWKRSKKRLIYRNPVDFNNKVKQFKLAIKKIPVNQIVSIDETSIDNYRIANYGWNISGKEVIRKKFMKKRVRYTLICGMSNNGIIHSKIVPGSAKSDHFNKFIKEISGKQSNMYMLMDNAAIHHNKKLANNLSNGNKIIYNAPYSPQYNPIEMLFSKIKRCMETNGTQPVQQQLIDILNGISKQETTNYFNHVFQNM